jgi:hypothetical protein
MSENGADEEQSKPPAPRSGRPAFAKSDIGE